MSVSNPNSCRKCRSFLEECFLPGESLDKAGSCHAERSWLSILGGEELSKSVLVANAGREAGEVGRR